MPPRAISAHAKADDDPIELEMRIAPSPQAPAQARAGVDRLREVLDGDLFADLQLVLSELVTNSAKYGPGEPIKVSVRFDGDKVTGDVSDRTQGRIELSDSTPPREGPRIGKWGLPMVERLASDWGLRNHDRTVWFRLATRPAKDLRNRDLGVV